MMGMVVNADMWLVAVLVWCAGLLILLRQPPAFGRWLSASEVATPWWVTLILLGGAAFSGKVLAFHIDKLLQAADTGRAG